MGVRSYVGARVDPTRRSLALAVGDLVAIATFVVAGAVRHGFPPLEYPVRAIDTFVPFLLGWTLAAVLGGLYTTDAIKNPRRILSWTVPAWVFALLVGHGLRATPLFHGGTSPVFFLVTLAVGGSVGIAWRLLVGFAWD